MFLNECLFKNIQLIAITPILVFMKQLKNIKALTHYEYWTLHQFFAKQIKRQNYSLSIF